MASDKSPGGGSPGRAPPPERGENTGGSPLRKRGDRVDDLKLYFASNLSRLRNQAGMKQSELGEMLNYSDKSVSKWERAESIPDAYVLKELGRIFGVSVDYLLSDHSKWEPEPQEDPEKRMWKNDAIMAAVMGVWAMTITLFVIFWLAGTILWFIPACAVPLTLVVLLVLNSLWNHGKNNVYIVAVLLAVVVACIYLFLHKFNPWQLFIILIPAEALVFFISRIAVKLRKNSHSTHSRTEKTGGRTV